MTIYGIERQHIVYNYGGYLLLYKMHIPKFNKKHPLRASLTVQNVRNFYIDYIMSYGGYGTVLRLYF